MLYACEFSIQWAKRHGYASGLAASGRCHFTSREARAALGFSAVAVKLTVSRPAKQS